MIVWLSDDLKRIFPYRCQYIEKYGWKIDENAYERPEDMELFSSSPGCYGKRGEEFYKKCIEEEKRISDFIKRTGRETWIL